AAFRRACYFAVALLALNCPLFRPPSFLSVAETLWSSPLMAFAPNSLRLFPSLRIRSMPPTASSIATAPEVMTLSSWSSALLESAHEDRREEREPIYGLRTPVSLRLPRIRFARRRTFLEPGLRAGSPRLARGKKPHRTCLSLPALLDGAFRKRPR